MTEHTRYYDIRADREWLEKHCGIVQYSGGIRSYGWGSCMLPKDHDGPHTWQEPIDYWGPRLEKALRNLTEILERGQS